MAHTHDTPHGDHPHDHEHAHHHASLNTAGDRRRVLIAIFLTTGFMLVEVVGALLSGSLALLADAAHMLTDSGSLILAWLGFRLAALPADDRRSFGWARFKVLAAFVNGVTLIILALWIMAEAIERMFDPPEIMGGLLLGVAIVGLLVNIIAFMVLHGGSREDLNMRGALWHVAGDLLGSLAAILAATIILSTGWMMIDPLLSGLVAVIIAVGGVRIVRQTGHILIEGVPRGVSLDDIREDLEQTIEAATRVDHIHAWALNETKILVTLDVEISDDASAETVRRAVKARLKERFGIDHATVETQLRETEA